MELDDIDTTDVNLDEDFLDDWDATLFPSTLQSLFKETKLPFPFFCICT